MTRVLPFVLLLAACGNQDPAGAMELRDRLVTLDYRVEFSRAPGYPMRAKSTGVHAADIDLFINRELERVFDVGASITEWPIDSLIVKDAYNGDTLKIVAAMEKRADGWFWAEWDNQGNALFSGRPGTCAGCHSAGDDFVRAFSFPGKP